MNKQFEFDYELEQDEGGKYWIASSKAFGFAGSGDSQDAAVENLRNSIRAYLRAMKRRGLLEEGLATKGIKWEEGYANW